MDEKITGKKKSSDANDIETHAEMKHPAPGHKELAVADWRG
jgi:hypothetical protein